MNLIQHNNELCITCSSYEQNELKKLFKKNEKDFSLDDEENFLFGNLLHDSYILTTADVLGCLSEAIVVYFPFTENEDIFFYSDYLIKSFLEDLMNYGEVIFKKI